MLPNILHQDKLLTLNTNDTPVIKDVLSEGISVQPLFLDVENGIWALRVIFEPGITLPKHFHTGTVHLWTLSGQWNYVEYPDQPQTAGSYLFEPGGSIHTLSTPADNTEPTETLMIVTGSNVNFDENDEYMNLMDAGWIEQAIVEAAKAQGVGKPVYISPGHSKLSTDD